MWVSILSDGFIITFYAADFLAFFLLHSFLNPSWSCCPPSPFLPVPAPAVTCSLSSGWPLPSSWSLFNFSDTHETCSQAAHGLSWAALISYIHRFPGALQMKSIRDNLVLPSHWNRHVLLTPVVSLQVLLVPSCWEEVMWSCTTIEWCQEVTAEMITSLLIKRFFLHVTGFYFYFRNIEDTKHTRRNFVMPDLPICQFLMVSFRGVEID